MGSLEDRLRREQQIVWPDYGGGSIVNLAAWVLRHFGGEPVWPVLSTPGFPHALADRADSVVILLVDGLGYLQLQRSLGDGAMPSLARLLDRPQSFHGSITSVFPSTTPTAFLALNTGRTPAECGVLADNQWEPRAKAIVNTLTWRTRYGGTSVFGSAELDVRPTIYESLRELDVKSSVVASDQFADGPMAALAHRGAAYLSCGSPSLLARLTAAATRDRGSAGTLVFAYWHGVDEVSHEYGPGSAQNAEGLRLLDHAVGRIGDLLEGTETLLLVTADHGQIAADRALEFPLNPHADIVQLLAVPAMGCRRGAWLRATEGRQNELHALVLDRFGDAVEVATAAEVSRSRLLGGEVERLEDKVGDLLVYPRHAGGIWYDPGQPDGGFHYQRGVHGGLSPEEMLVPLIAVVL